MLSADRRDCQLSQPVVVTSQTGSMSSMTSQRLGVGTAECPWRIRALPGQHITLSLRYFHPDSGAPKPAATSSPSNCYELATVADDAGESRTGGKTRSITSCDGQQRGEQELWTSSSSEISVQMVGRMTLKTLGRFIISYRGH